jgi:hypothetical protein
MVRPIHVLDGELTEVPAAARYNPYFDLPPA